MKTQQGVEQVIIGLTERDKVFSNPLQLTEHVQLMLRRQAEQGNQSNILEPGRL